MLWDYAATPETMLRSEANSWRIFLEAGVRLKLHISPWPRRGTSSWVPVLLPDLGPAGLTFLGRRIFAPGIFPNDARECESLCAADGGRADEDPSVVPFFDHRGTSVLRARSGLPPQPPASPGSVPEGVFACAGVVNGWRVRLYHSLLRPKTLPAA